ncbi:MAG: hypothetical protein R3C56_35855 [Pirellulaceae bacterium]
MYDLQQEQAAIAELLWVYPQRGYGRLISLGQRSPFTTSIAAFIDLKLILGTAIAFAFVIEPISVASESLRAKVLARRSGEHPDALSLLRISLGNSPASTHKAML